MALDEHRIAWAGVYGAAGTFLASAGVSVIAAMVANPSPPIWAWFLSAPLLLFGFILLFVAYWSWSRGVNPKPPRDPMPVRDVLSAVDKHFPHLVGAYTYTTAFLQDARNRRHKIWGRI